MGIKPARMVPIAYPSEWLLDIFHNGARCTRISRQPYVCMIQTPPMPWALVWGWRIVAGLLILAAAVLWLGLH
jgi:hypothetical protein